MGRKRNKTCAQQNMICISLVERNTEREGGIGRGAGREGEGREKGGRGGMLEGRGLALH